jgi:5-methylcytosine-specific restriction endonuclease McrA
VSDEPYALFDGVLDDDECVRVFMPDVMRLQDRERDDPTWTMPWTARDWFAQPVPWIDDADRIALNNWRDELGGTLTRAEWDAMVVALDHRCAYCDKLMPRLVIEHVVPLSRNGRTSADNILPACGACNVRKRNKELHEWKRDDPAWWGDFLGRLVRAAERMGESLETKKPTG